MAGHSSVSTEFMSMLRLVRALSDLKREIRRDRSAEKNEKEKDVSIKIEISQHHHRHGRPLSPSTTIMSIVSSRERG